LAIHHIKAGVRPAFALIADNQGHRVSYDKTRNA